MSDTPKFEVIDRRKYKVEDESTEASETDTPAAEQPVVETPAPAVASGGPRLVTPEPEPVSAEETQDGGDSAAGGEEAGFQESFPGMPPPPTADESREQKMAFDAASQRLEDLVRAQNPAAGPQPPVSFEHLVQQLYLSAMIQMGAGTQEGQRPRVDILSAKQTIDLLGVLQEKTKGNLSLTEERMLDTVLFEARMAFLELTNMISMPGVPPKPPAPGKR